MLFWYEKLKQVCVQHHFNENYIKKQQLGEGAFAQVIKCERIADQEIYAVKIFDKVKLEKQKNQDLYRVL